MLKTVLSKLLMVLYFICGALILEAVTFHILGMGIMPEYFGYNFAIIMFLAILIFIIPNFTAQYVIYTIILGVQAIMIYVNYSLYTIYGDLFSMDMIRLLDEAGAAMTSSFIYFSVILQLVLVYIAIVVVGYMMLRKCKKDKIKIRQHYSIFNVILILALQCFVCTYYIDERLYINNLADVDSANYVSSDTFLMNTSFLKYSSYSKFGSYGYMTNLLLGMNDKIDEEIQKATIEYFNSGEKYNYTDSEVFGVDSGNNVIVIMMESLEWFCFGDGNYDSNYNNLSYELTPNIYSLIYGEDYLTDTNNENISNDSLLAKKFFAKSKTNYSEAYAILGNYPVGEGLTDIAGDSYDPALNAFNYSMPGILSELGYNTSYVHSHKIGFYDRNKTHSNLGFENVVGKDTVLDEEGNPVYSKEETSWDHWDAEGDFVRNAIDYIIPSDYDERPFYTFYLTVSTHGSYEYNEDEGDCMRYHNYVRWGEDDCVYNEVTGCWDLKDEDANLEDLTPTNWYANVLKNYEEDYPELCEELVYYQCGAMGLDEAIGVIIDKLKEYDIYDETTIVLFSDHYSYYNKLANKVKGFDEDDYSSIELNTIPMIISSPGLKEFNSTQTDSEDVVYTENTRFCSAYDIIPTVFDLLGVSFNENLYLGHSLFTPLEHTYQLDGEQVDMVVYYSNTGGLFCRNVYTYNLNEYVFNGMEEDQEIIDRFNAEIKNVLIKMNYLQILNDNYLYNQLTNK